MNHKLSGFAAIGTVSVCVAAAIAWLTTRVLVPSVEAEPLQIPKARSVQAVGRQVRIVSFSFYNRPIDEIVRLIDDEGARGADLIVLPETWTGTEPVPVDGELMKQLTSLAKTHRTYIVNSVYRRADGKDFNSAILIDRDGRIAGIYDKAFPYWGELDKNDRLSAGADIPVFNTDFGKLGIAICFDVNFPELWSRLADRHAELVVWPSAYVAGSALQAHAINHHYYIVTATWPGHTLAYDITGEQLLSSKRDGVNVTRLALDLDRRVYHENFNWDKAQQILKDHPDNVALDKFLKLEQWFVLKAKRPGVNIIAIADKYGLEGHRDYVRRSRDEMDRRRGFSFVAPTKRPNDQISIKNDPALRKIGGNKGPEPAPR